MDLSYDKVKNECLCICELTVYKKFCRFKKENIESKVRHLHLTRMERMYCLTHIYLMVAVCE